MKEIKKLNLGDHPRSNIQEKIEKTSSKKTKEISDILSEELNFDETYSNIKSNRDESTINNKDLNKKDKDRFTEINDALEETLSKKWVPRSVRKKIYFAALELSDNIINYSPWIKNQIRIKISHWIISITTKNLMKKNNEYKEKLRKNIKELNKLSNEELKERYKKVLQNEIFNEQGWAWLWLIKMARSARKTNTNEKWIYSVEFKNPTENEKNKNYDIVKIKLEIPLKLAS